MRDILDITNKNTSMSKKLSRNHQEIDENHQFVTRNNDGENFTH